MFKESYSLTPSSSNAKTGIGVAVSTSSAVTCPDSCALKAKGCYASAGPIAIHWRKVSNGLRGLSWGEFIKSVLELPKGWKFRHNQAGDLPGENEKIDSVKLGKLSEAIKNRKLLAWTYTHKPLTKNNLFAIKSAIKNGFVINASADNLSQADEKSDLGLPVVVVLPQDSANTLFTPKGRKIVVCPAQNKENVSCSSCMLCHKANRSVIVGFKAHGVYKKAVSVLAAA